MAAGRRDQDENQDKCPCAHGGFPFSDRVPVGTPDPIMPSCRKETLRGAQRRLICERRIRGTDRERAVCVSFTDGRRLKFGEQKAPPAGTDGAVCRRVAGTYFTRPPGEPTKPAFEPQCPLSCLFRRLYLQVRTTGRAVLDRRL